MNLPDPETWWANGQWQRINVPWASATPTVPAPAIPAQQLVWAGSWGFGSAWHSQRRSSLPWKFETERNERTDLKEWVYGEMESGRKCVCLSLSLRVFRWLQCDNTQSNCIPQTWLGGVGVRYVSHGMTLLWNEDFMLLDYWLELRTAELELRIISSKWIEKSSRVMSLSLTINSHLIYSNIYIYIYSDSWSVWSVRSSIAQDRKVMAAATKELDNRRFVCVCQLLFAWSTPQSRRLASACHGRPARNTSVSIEHGDLGGSKQLWNWFLSFLDSYV